MNTKNKKNSGFDNLKDLDMAVISGGANLKENFTSRNSNQKEERAAVVVKSLVIPAEFDKIIRDAKERRLIIGSLNSYIVEAMRKRMVEDGLL